LFYTNKLTVCTHSKSYLLGKCIWQYFRTCALCLTSKPKPPKLPFVYIVLLHCGSGLSITNLFCWSPTGKPRGLRTARKHVNHRRDQRWADKDYKKAHLGTRWKANPFGGASHAKGIVLEKV